MLDFGSDLPSRGFLQMKPCGVLHISSFQNLNQEMREGGKKMVGAMFDGYYAHIHFISGDYAKRKNSRNLVELKLVAICSQMAATLI